MSFLSLKDAEPEKIVSEALGLNELEEEIYFSLRGEELTVKDLVGETGRSRSVVQRALQSLLNKGVVMREGRTDRTVYYVYTAVPFEKVEEKVSKIIDSWYKDVKDKLE
ncbi:MAG: GntR family transcriptional regulator [Candidatus Nanohaloarchaeota archaeon QJJ-9]|nr:GntR family transcriptional regulator [Candidatus Nanohaloarchaeota archaeon QJJ-9]